MSQRGTVQLVHLNGFVAGGRWSGGLEQHNHMPYLAPVPLSRYNDPEDVQKDLLEAHTHKRHTEQLHKSRADTRLAGPHWMHDTNKESIWDRVETKQP